MIATMFYSVHIFMTVSNIFCIIFPLSLTNLPGHYDAVILLRAYGANVNLRRRDGASPLHLACTSPNLRLALFLLSQGAEVDCRNAKGETPLHLAVEAVRV